MSTRDTSWGGVADWYHKHLSDPDSYHTNVLLPHMLRLMNVEANTRVLDLACGTGFFTREYAQVSQYVTGVDISSELIDIARGYVPTHTTFIVSSATDLSGIPNASIDAISFVLAIQNIEDVQTVLKECARVLAPRGTMHIVMNHPAFRIPKASSWGFDESAGVQYRRVDAYLSESRTDIDMHPGADTKEKTISFHRPLQWYVKACVAQGFAITRLEEWISHKQSEQGPKKAQEDRARKEIPLFLYIQIQKQ